MNNTFIAAGRKIKLEVEIISPYLSFVGTIKKIEEGHIVVKIEGSYVQKYEKKVRCTILNDRKVCVFETVIKGCIENQIILVMPKAETIQVMQRRKYVRALVDFPVHCFLVGYNDKKINSNKKFPVTVKDISGGGVLLSSSLSLPIGTVLVFELELEQQLFILTVKVIRNIENKVEKNRSLGCEFLGITDGDRQKIISFTNKMQLQSKRKQTNYL
ncbi:MAG: PilZ domain-containing protein [Clostridiaceae bacterium]|nr:PilZ domain-containing protein [Clostridiaceae bacterium]